MEDIIEERKPSKKELLILANQKIEQLEKELTQQKGYVEMYRKESAERKSQTDEIHDFLDGLPNVMPKTKDGWNENKVSTRLLSWIASKAAL